jgi:hypothetical protein
MSLSQDNCPPNEIATIIFNNLLKVHYTTASVFFSDLGENISDVTKTNIIKSLKTYGCNVIESDTISFVVSIPSSFLPNIHSCI